jgi:hypothetical protein
MKTINSRFNRWYDRKNQDARLGLLMGYVAAALGTPVLVAIIRAYPDANALAAAQVTATIWGAILLLPLCLSRVIYARRVSTRGRLRV